MTGKPTFADPANVMGRAADMMRVHASKAVAGPWMSDDNDLTWSLHMRDWPMQILKAPKNHKCPNYAEYWPDADTGRYITEWHPGVALAVADLLDVVRQTTPTPENGVGMLWIMALRLAGQYLDVADRDDPGEERRAVGCA